MLEWENYITVMSNEIITKRLHISGLTTPAITPTDLANRLSAFGRIISLDDFGEVDALGQRRPFGYVTIEGRRTDLAKCEFSFCHHIPLGLIVVGQA